MRAPASRLVCRPRTPSWPLSPRRTLPAARSLGERSRGEDHRDATKLVAQVQPGGNDAAKALGRLLAINSTASPRSRARTASSRSAKPGGSWSSPKRSSTAPRDPLPPTRLLRVRGPNAAHETHAYAAANPPGPRKAAYPGPSESPLPDSNRRPLPSLDLSRLPTLATLISANAIQGSGRFLY
jgi:hypothetical protein